MYGCSKYNTITNQLIKQVPEWILFNINIKSSFVSSVAVIIKLKGMLPKNLMRFPNKDLQNDMVKPSNKGGLECVFD